VLEGLRDVSLKQQSETIADVGQIDGKHKITTKTTIKA